MRGFLSMNYRDNTGKNVSLYFVIVCRFYIYICPKQKSHPVRKNLVALC